MALCEICVRIKNLEKLKTSSSCSILCLRNEWVQVCVSSYVPNSETDFKITFWDYNDQGKEHEERVEKVHFASFWELFVIDPIIKRCWVKEMTFVDSLSG